MTKIIKFTQEELCDLMMGKTLTSRGECISCPDGCENAHGGCKINLQFEKDE